jgi:dTDP-L-rhamnose 4-epimerase
MKNILITGGAGFIGSNLAQAFTGKGYNITVLDNLSPQIHGIQPIVTSPLYQSIMGKVNLIQGTVTSREDWLKALEGQDGIIHLAAETGTGQSMYEIKKYCDVNICGTALLLDILTNQKHSIQKIIIASSRAIYGEGKYECAVHGVVFPEARKDKDLQNGEFECKCPVCQGNVRILPTSEESMIHPTSVYGITKQNQEQMVLTIGKAIGIPAVALRFQNVYGPGQSLTNPYTGILSIFSTLIRQNKNINIFEDGEESRDFVFIDDVVEATFLAFVKNEANNLVFNIGSGASINVNTVVKILLENYNNLVKAEISGNYRLGDIRHNFADIRQAKEILGFEPAFNFCQGIEKFTTWVKKQEISSSGYENSLQEMKLKNLLK